MKLLAVGSPLIDVLAHVSDDFLRQNISGVRGGRETLTPVQLNQLLQQLGSKVERRCGGAAANTARALAELGVEVALFGKAGADEPGRFFAENFRQTGGSTQELLYDFLEPTGQCLSLITPDAERTMRAELGASQHITLEEVAQLDLAKYDIVYLEGFQLAAPYFKLLVQKAHEAGCRLVLDLGSVEVVQAQKTQLPELLKQYFYLVLANFEEAQALCDTADLRRQLEKLNSWCPVAVVKQGVQGSAVSSENMVCQVPAQRVRQAIDTTGAGDFYAAGFLYGLISGATWQDCARYGSIISAEVVQVDGTTLPTMRWAELKKQLNTAHTTI